MTPELLLAIISGAAGAFAGLTRALSGFNKRIEKRFEALEQELDTFQTQVVHDYVLKEDFLREIQAVHNKLDRILDYILNANRKS